MTTSAKPGMTRHQANAIRNTILGLCIVSLVMIFQPFSLTLFGIGATLVVVGGLAFNLVPLCEPGRPLSSVVKAGLVVLVILVIVVALAIGSAALYGVYVRS